MKLNISTSHGSDYIWFAVAILSLFFCVLWIPALDTPFWGDDYAFLQAAHAANMVGDPWWAAFWPDEPSKFWRPLSEQSFWRIVDYLIGADPRTAHLFNLGLFILAGISVGLFGLVLARSCEWPNSLGIGVLGGFLYLSLALNLLPVHWVSAANSSILTIFTAICLALWIAAPQANKVLRTLLLMAIPVLLMAALLSKDSAALTPLLMLVVSVFVGKKVRPRRADVLVWLICCGIVAAWLVLRSNFTEGIDPQYDLILGKNLIRNFLSLGAWLLNVPREALRMTQMGPMTLALLWVSAVALPMLVAWSIAAHPLLRGLERRQVLAAIAFVLLAYAPYFALAWNSYAYYAAVAAILPTLVLARGLVKSRFILIAVTLVGVSSMIAVQGTRWLDHPGLFGRAHWAEETLSMLEKERIPRPLLVRRDDCQRFYAMGVAGLAWRLRLAQEDVRLVESCPEGADKCLVIDPDGEWSWEGRGSGLGSNSADR